jgi:hypothetical protein
MRLLLLLLLLLSGHAPSPQGLQPASVTRIRTTNQQQKKR